MQISPNKVVTLTYTLHIGAEKDTVEIIGEEDPMVFIQGLSGLPEGFENKLEGLSAGDTFDFSVNPEEGYGDEDPEAIVELPIDMFQIEDGKVPEGMLEIGNFIPMTNDEGQRLTGKILEVSATDVKLDFNHPLAGKEMHFEGKILSVREATADELDHGHVHGEGGVHHH